MADPTPNKFAQLQQFWQKGKPSAAASAAPAQPLLRQPAPAHAADAEASAAPAFDPYGATDDLDFVPENKEDAPATSTAQSAASDLYTLDEHFNGEEDDDDDQPRDVAAEETKKGEKEEKQQQTRDEAASSSKRQHPPPTSDSLYAVDEAFVSEDGDEARSDVDDEGKRAADDVAPPSTTESDSDAGESRYAYSAASDVAYAVMDDQFNPEQEQPEPVVSKVQPTAHVSSASPAPSYGADSSAIQDIYGMAEGTSLSTEDDGAYRVRETATPYETFQPDSPSAAYYSEAIDELAADKETSASLYGEDEDARIPSAYGTEDVEGVTADKQSDKAYCSDSEDDFTDSEDEDKDSGKKPKGDQTKNWNSDFQRLLDMPPSAEKFTKLARLAHDFVFAAETYGKIIISELGLPEAKKTIKPVAAGGQAGGEKYIVQGIFFKFALDIFGIYGGDEYAMKAASHDLKGLIHYYSCQIPGLHVPLMALIDYLGFRLIAITILPINGNTIKYGSCNAGQTVHADDSRLNVMMEQAGRKMRLQGHYVGVPGGIPRQLYAPVDIEGHLGLDGRYYVVDFARTFPPERPSPTNMKRKGIILFNLLRPELVKSNKVPLSPDAFTLWAKADENKDLYNSQVTEATRRLLKELIPKVATRLNELQQSTEQGTTHFDLIEVIHSAGVNIRHLGYLRRLVNEGVQDIIMIEMIARVVRKQLQEKFRKKTRFAGVPTEEPQKLSAVKYLNKMLGRHETSALHWRLFKRALVFKFPRSLLDHELDDSYDLRQRINVSKLFERLQKVAPNIFVLSEEARKDFTTAVRAHNDAGESWDKTPPSFKFLPSDLMPLAASIKHMNLIDIAEASAMFYGSLEEEGNDQVRLLIQGLGKFQVAARKMPFIDADTVVSLGDMLVARAQGCKKNDMCTPETESALAGALIAFQTALNIHPQNARCLMGLGDIYVVKNEFKEARNKYREALESEPNNVDAHIKLASTFEPSRRDNESEEDRQEQEALLRRALEYSPQHATALTKLANLLLRHVIAVRPDNDAECEKRTEEAAHLYSRVLDVRPDTELFEPLRGMIVHLSQNSDVSKHKGSYLKLLWSVMKSHDVLKQLCHDALAKLTALHLEFAPAVDLVFDMIASNASKVTELSLRLSDDQPLLPTEPAVRDWLLNHQTPLQVLSFVRLTQLGDDFLQALGGSIHRQSLNKLVLAKSSHTKEALLQLFQAEAWPSLAELDLSDTTAVNKEILAAVQTMCPALTTLNIHNAPVGDEIIENLPSLLTKLYLGGQLTKDPLYEAFTQRCTGLTHVSFRDVKSLQFADVYSLAAALPNLVWVEYPSGEVQHWSGNASVQVKYEERGHVQSFWFKEIVYQVMIQGPVTYINGSSVHLSIQGNNFGRFVSQAGHKLFSGTYANQAGWIFRYELPNMRGFTSVKYNQQMKHFQIAPQGIGTVQVMPFGNSCTITFPPRQNITLNLAAFFIGFVYKM